VSEVIVIPPWNSAAGGPPPADCREGNVGNTNNVRRVHWWPGPWVVESVRIVPVIKTFTAGREGNIGNTNNVRRVLLYVSGMQFFGYFPTVLGYVELYADMKLIPKQFLAM
jgi:hypothetical protein